MKRPNVLLLLADQERQRDWIPAGLELPNRQRLIDGGLEFTRYYTHTSPCSPSRGTLFTGQYMPVHGVNENCIEPANGELGTDANTLGKIFRDQGYYTAYKGKWHLTFGAYPDMDAYGFSDWEGNDKSFWGQAGSGTEFDEPITRSAADWILGAAPSDQPWFLAVGLVNPHDVMWYPMDQPWYQESNPLHFESVRDRHHKLNWGRDDPLPSFELPYDEWFTELPANFDDDLHTKPDVHRRFIHEASRSCGWLDRSDTEHWLRQLDYYAKLHQMSDENIGHVLSALDETGGWDNTIVVFTSDHGEQCGSHGLRSKGPWNYEETMRIPLYMVVPGKTVAGSATDAMFSHVDLARTIAGFSGVGEDLLEGWPGRQMDDVLLDSSTTGRSELLFAQDWAWYDGLLDTRYASRGVFDGRFKYCRYYGIGGSSTTRGTPITSPKRFDRDAAFDDQEHEFYDLQEDPHELVNLAMDRGRRREVRRWFDDLLALEQEEFLGL